MFKRQERSEWMEGLLAAEEMHRGSNCIQVVIDYYFNKMIPTTEFGLGFGEYIANSER